MEGTECEPLLAMSTLALPRRHSGAIQGFFDGHPIVNWRHENLMRLFFRALRSFVKPGGFVKAAGLAPLARQLMGGLTAGRAAKAAQLSCSTAAGCVEASCRSRASVATHWRLGEILS